MPTWLLQCLPIELAREFAQAKRQQSSGEFRKSLNGEKQLLVDVSVVYKNDARTGIQRVVRALLLQLLASPPHGYRIRPVFATRQQPYSYAEINFLTSPRQITTADSTAQPELVEVESDDIFLALDLAAHLLPRHKSQLLRWKRQGVCIHAVVYDLLPLQHPEWFNPKTTRNFKLWLTWLIVYADSAICISNTVNTELKTWMSLSYQKFKPAITTSTITLGADIDATAPTKGLSPSGKFLLARLLTTPAILMVGTLEPRKGYDQALAAFEILWKSSTKTPLLVIVGRRGWKTENLQKKLKTHPDAEKKFFWLEDVSDEMLNRLYECSKGVLIASKAEGFGLPLVEAALNNKPILARDLPVLKENKIPNVTYFTASTACELATELQQWIDKISILSKYSIKSFKKPILPTWQKSTEELLDALGIVKTNKILLLKNSNN